MKFNVDYDAKIVGPLPAITLTQMKTPLVPVVVDSYFNGIYGVTLPPTRGNRLTTFLSYWEIYSLKEIYSGTWKTKSVDKIRQDQSFAIIFPF